MENHLGFMNRNNNIPLWYLGTVGNDAGTSVVGTLEQQLLINAATYYPLVIKFN